MSHRKHKKNLRRTWFLRAAFVGIIVIFLLLLAIVAGKWAENQKNKQLQQFPYGAAETISDRYAEKTITVNGKKYKSKSNMEAILFIGVDTNEEQSNTDGYLNTNQADVLLLTAIDHNTKSYTTIAINRDTIAKVPVLDIKGQFADWRTQQIALAHTYGSGMQDSCENTVLAVSEFLFQTPILHYISFSMPAIGVMNDAVGGVTVTINDDFGGSNGLIQGETIRLNSSQAETYVRGRQGVGDQTNINRMNRQKTYITAWRDTALSCIASDNEFLLSMLELLSDHMVSDMSINDLSNLANNFSDYTDNGIRDIDGNSVKGEQYMEFYVDDNALKELILSIFYDAV